MIRNEEHYVQEWLTFHHIQGFEQFVIVLHKCNDKTEERIKTLPFADKVHIHKIADETQVAQMAAFAWMMEHYGHTTEWMLFCDGDEFTFGTDTDDFREVLAGYEDFGGLFVNWLEYGHCDQIERPERLCIETFTKRQPESSWWHTSGKSIVRPKEVLKPYRPADRLAPLNYSLLSPHLFRTRKPTVHGDYTPVSYRHFWRTEHQCYKVARCNHYRYRSLEDWKRRMFRGNANDATVNPSPCDTNKMYNISEWEKCGKAQIEDISAMRFADKVKEILNER